MRLICLSMVRFGSIQLLGPAVLIAAVLSAEGAAYALAYFPSSAWLWYLNVEWFGMFQESHYILSSPLGLDCEQLLVVALPIFAAAALGLVFKKSLLVAIASNLSFVYIAFVVFTSLHASAVTKTASLSMPHMASSGPDTFLLAVLVGVSLISFVVSHILYIQKARALA